MSKLSTVYDALITRVAAVLTSHTRIPNPYKIEENAKVLLVKGYGVALKAGSPVDKQISCYLDYTRTFDVIITRQFYATESDVSSKATMEKQLLEDQFLVLYDIGRDPDLGTTSVATFKFAGDTGIEYIFDDTDKFLKITMSFDARILENLN